VVSASKLKQAKYIRVINSLCLFLFFFCVFWFYFWASSVSYNKVEVEVESSDLRTCLCGAKSASRVVLHPHPLLCMLEANRRQFFSRGQLRVTDRPSVRDKLKRSQQVAACWPMLNWRSISLKVTPPPFCGVPSFCSSI